VIAGDHLFLFHPPSQQEILADSADSAAIDAGATTAAWSAGGHLNILRLQPRLKVVSPGDDTLVETAPRVSIDGRRILFLSRRADSTAAQVFVIQPDGTGRRQITNEAEGVSRAVLSGDGRVAYAETTAGRIVRVQVDTLERYELNGPTPAILDRTVTAGIGSSVTVTTSTRAGQSVSVDIDGSPAPLVSASDGSVIFQVPWEFATNTLHGVGLKTGATATWEGPTLALTSATYYPQFLLTASAGYAVAAHQDWASVITPDNPARVGEIVHMYATGLGSVSPAVPTGTPAPASPPSTLTTTFDCFVPPSGSQNAKFVADVFYIGLAPGMVGFYQLDVRLPASADYSYYSLICELIYGSGTISQFGALVPTRP